MQMKPVASSNIAAIGHKGLLMHVQFKHGGTYAYHPVTADQHAKLLAAPSIGAHLNTLGVKGVKVEEKKAD